MQRVSARSGSRCGEVTDLPLVSPHESVVAAARIAVIEKRGEQL
jgi:hypothetical protein